LLDGFRKDLEQEGTRAFVVDLANDPLYKVVTTLFVDDLRDKSAIQLADKEFQMLGKAVRVISASSNEAIDLLSGTGLGGFNDAALGQLTGRLTNLSRAGIYLKL
jgi:outer membrane lipoprotein SlyB